MAIFNSHVGLPEGIGSPAPWWRGGLGTGVEVSWFFPASGLAAWPNGGTQFPKG